MGILKALQIRSGCNQLAPSAGTLTSTSSPMSREEPLMGSPLASPVGLAKWDQAKVQQLQTWLGQGSPFGWPGGICGGPRETCEGHSDRFSPIANECSAMNASTKK